MVEDKIFKTVKLCPTTKALLDTLKVHPREPYDEVIRRIINTAEAKQQQRKQRTRWGV